MLIGHFPLLWFSSCPCERVLEVRIYTAPTPNAHKQPNPKRTLHIKQANLLLDRLL
jgi:hypothetical protein